MFRSSQQKRKRNNKINEPTEKTTDPHFRFLARNHLAVGRLGGGWAQCVCALFLHRRADFEKKISQAFTRYEQAIFKLANKLI